MKNTSSLHSTPSKSFGWILLCLIGIFLYTTACFKNDNTYFKDTIGFAPTKDVKNIHHYSDELGIDASYWLAFTCDDSTIEKIVTKMDLTKSRIATDGLIGGLNMQPTPWWDTSFVKHSKPFIKEEERLRWYLWFNYDTHQAYFLTYDL